MSKIKELEKIKLEVENMIYEIRGKQVMLDREILSTKCHNHLYDKMILSK